MAEFLFQIVSKPIIVNQVNRFMKYTILFVIAALAMSLIFIACSSSKNNNSDDSSARKGEISSINVEQLSNKWKHVKTKDSYDNIWKEVESDHKIISFTEDGKYTELKPGNDLCEGTYTAKEESVVVNHSCNQVALTYKVESLNKTDLVLSIQGRHGPVFYVYEETK